MKNHPERVAALLKTHPNGRLECPLDCQRVCRVPEFCAHYDPDRQECVHVLAAQAQMRAAEALERLAKATGVDCINGTTYLRIASIE